MCRLLNIKDYSLSLHHNDCTFNGSISTSESLHGIYSINKEIKGNNECLLLILFSSSFVIADTVWTICMFVYGNYIFSLTVLFCFFWLIKVLVLFWKNCLKWLPVLVWMHKPKSFCWFFFPSEGNWEMAANCIIVVMMF